MENDIKTGGPAFPTLAVLGDIAMSEGGLTVRDCIAIKALPVLMTECRSELALAALCREPAISDDEFRAMVTKLSYEWADSMLAAREGKV